MFDSFKNPDYYHVENPLHIWATTCSNGSFGKSRYYEEEDEGEDNALFDVFFRIDTSKLSLDEETAFENDLEKACSYRDDEFESVTITPVINPKCTPTDPDINEWIYGCYEIRGELTEWVIDNIIDVFCKYDVEYSEKIKG